MRSACQGRACLEAVVMERDSLLQYKPQFSEGEPKSLELIRLGLTDPGGCSVGSQVCPRTGHTHGSGSVARVSVSPRPWAGGTLFEIEHVTHLQAVDHTVESKKTKLRRENFLSLLLLFAFLIKPSNTSRLLDLHGQPRGRVAR